MGEIIQLRSRSGFSFKNSDHFAQIEVLGITAYLQALSAELGWPVPVSTLESWRQGKSSPPDYVLQVAERVLGKAHVLKASSMSSELPEDSAELIDVKRRTFINLTSAGSLGIADPVVKAIDHLGTLDGQPNKTLLDGLEDLIAQFGEQYSRTPPLNVYRRLEPLIDKTRNLLAFAKPCHRKQLYSIDGWLTSIAANSLYDLGDRVAAEANALLALEEADRSGDSKLTAFVLDRQAMRTENAKSLRKALNRFEAGFKQAPKHSAIQLRSLTAYARIWARLGEHKLASSALKQAEKLHSQLPETELGDGSLSISPIAVIDTLSSVAEYGGDLEEARRAAKQTITYYESLPHPNHRPTRVALAQLRLASILSRLDGPDEAMSIVASALSTERVVPPVLLNAGSVVEGLLKSWPDLREASELRERYQVMAKRSTHSGSLHPC